MSTDGPPRCVDQQRTGLHPGERIGVEQTASVVGQRHEDDHRIGLAEQARQLVDRVNAVAGPAGDAWKRTPNGSSRFSTAAPIEPWPRIRTVASSTSSSSR